MQSFLTNSLEAIKDKLYSDFCFDVEIDGQNYFHSCQIPGYIISKQYFRTHGSAVENAAIVVNKVLWYAIRLIYVDYCTGSIMVTKICDRNKEEEAMNISTMVQTTLQTDAGYFCIDSKVQYPDIKCGGQLQITQRRSCEFLLSSFKWWKEPLKGDNSIFGFHSKIEVTFKHERVNDLCISLIVERTQSGVYWDEKHNVMNCIWGELQMHDAAESYQLNNINLKAFLIECNKQNEHKYEVNKHDCHYLASVMWNFCVHDVHAKQPDERKRWLFAPIASIILPKEKSGTYWKNSVNDVNPACKNDNEILENLGVEHDHIYDKKYIPL